MKVLNDILTGSDNSTIAVGRVIGVILMALVVITPIVELFTIKWNVFSIEDWKRLLDQWQTWVPIMIGSATGVIRFTAPTEPSSHHKEDE